MTNPWKSWLASRRAWAVIASFAGVAALLTTAAMGGFGGGESGDEATGTATPRTVRTTQRPKTPTASPTASPTATPEVTEEPIVTHEDHAIEGPPPAPRGPAPAAPAAPPVPASPPVNIMHGPPYTVVIDPGHGPNNSGAGNGSYGLIERHVTLDVSLRLAPILSAAGYNVILTRYGDYNLTQVDADTAIERRDELQARVDLANQAQADILVSVHFNGSSASYLRGLEIYYNPDRSYGQFNYALADFARHGLLTSMRATGYDVVDRGVKNDSGVGGDPRNPHSWLLGTNENFRPSMMPGIIGEALFLSNNQDAQQLTYPHMRQAIAEGYKAGIDAYFGWLQAQLPPTPTPTPTPTPEPTPSPEPTPLPTPSPSETPSSTPSPTPASTPTPTDVVAGWSSPDFSIPNWSRRT